MAYTFSWPDNTFFAEFTGVVTASEIEAVNHAFSGDARLDSVRYSIWDLSRATSIEMPGQEVVYAAAFDKGVAAVRKSLRGALIATEPQVRATIERYLSAADGLGVGWDTRLFDDLQTARAWLDAHS